MSQYPKIGLGKQSLKVPFAFSKSRSRLNTCFSSAEILLFLSPIDKLRSLIC